MNVLRGLTRANREKIDGTLTRARGRARAFLPLPPHHHPTPPHPISANTHADTHTQARTHSRTHMPHMRASPLTRPRDRRRSGAVSPERRVSSGPLFGASLRGLSYPRCRNHSAVRRARAGARVAAPAAPTGSLPGWRGGGRGAAAEAGVSVVECGWGGGRWVR